MAGSEVFEKNKALFTPIATDYIRAIDDPGGTPLSGNVLFSNNIAGKLYSTNGTTYPVGTLTDTEYLKVSGGTIITGTVASGGSTASSDGWNTMPGTTTYVSADSPSYVVSINSDIGTLVQAGHRMKWTQGTTIGYGIVTNVGTYTSGTIPVTVYGGTAYTIGTAAIGSVYYSPVKAPYGFITNPTYWTVRATDTTIRSQVAGTGTWYNLGTVTISIPIGVWEGGYDAVLQPNAASAQQLEIVSTLSTANNSESDSSMSKFVGANALIATIIPVSLKDKILSAAAKTTYYFNTKTDINGITIYNRNDKSALVISFTSAYL